MNLKMETRLLSWISVLKLFKQTKIKSFIDYNFKIFYNNISYFS